MTDFKGLTHFEQVVITASRIFEDMTVYSNSVFGGSVGHILGDSGFMLIATNNAVTILKAGDDDNKRVVFYSSIEQLDHILRTSKDLVKEMEASND